MDASFNAVDSGLRRSRSIISARFLPHTKVWRDRSGFTQEVDEVSANLNHQIALQQFCCIAPSVSLFCSTRLYRLRTYNKKGRTMSDSQNPTWMTKYGRRRVRQ